MTTYFNFEDSIYAKVGASPDKIIRTVANRYIGQNPPELFTYRAYNNNGIRKLEDYRLNFDFSEIYPLAGNQTIVYAWSKYWSNTDGEIMFKMWGYSAFVFYANGEQAFKSSVENERDSSLTSKFKVKLKKGYNDLVIKFIRTNMGCGGILGNFSTRNFPIFCIMPSKERDGQEGWLYTLPLEKELETLPSQGMSEVDTGVKWYPHDKWLELELKSGQIKRIFGYRKNTYAVAWTKFNSKLPDKAEFTLEGETKGAAEIYVDGRLVYKNSESVQVNKTFDVTFGEHDLIIKSSCTDTDWGFEISVKNKGTEVELKKPVDCKGTEEKWFYAGLFDEAGKFDPTAFATMDSVFEGVDGKVYWRLDAPSTFVRPYSPEDTLFGKWNYPLGVTLYGLLSVGRFLGLQDIVSYVKEHIESATAAFDYAMWESEYFGTATLHNLLTTIDSLDDCGSFGSAMLETAKYCDLKGYRKVADYIADYITKDQTRLADGSFYRHTSTMPLMRDTLWADDLYMSIPYLLRYYQLTGDEAYLNDSIKQVKNFKKYLFRPNLKIMSHVYDVKNAKATEVSWGRGNGWVLFTYSELLQVMPENHKDRATVLENFRELCEGYAALQDEEGMWHQVLNDLTSYQESSCTSMFVYAFARAVRFGWLENREKYVEAVLKGFEALAKKAVDCHGNVYGVCRGSDFSFTEDYYKNELSWNLNDTHGTGIIMLAGIETLNMQKFLKEQNN